MAHFATPASSAAESLLSREWVKAQWENAAVARKEKGASAVRRAGSGWVPAAVVALLVVYGAMAFSASLTKGVSFDEGLQLASGYNIWLNHDLRMEGANGDLVKRWATLPYLLSRPHFVSHDDPLWKQSRAYDLGWKFFFELGNQPESLLWQSRAMIALLGMAAGLLVFCCSRALFGAAGGFVSLLLFVFSPSMLAFGGVVSTDMTITLTLLASVWWIWRLLHEVSGGRVLGSLAWTGLLVLAKPTALVIFPIAAVMIAVRLGMRAAMVIQWRGAAIVLRRRRSQCVVILAMALWHGTAAWAAIWAHYEFRYTAAPAGHADLSLYKLPTRDNSVPPVLTALLATMRKTHFLPEGFLAGIDLLLECDDGLAAFMNGHWRLGGWRWFFPFAIWVKTPPPLMILLALGGVGWWFRRRDQSKSQAGDDAEVPRWYAVTPHLALIGCYLAIAMTEDLNIGHRHVLPIYPSLYVLAGSVALAWRKWQRVGMGLTAGGIGWLVLESVAIRPHYLAYFGPQAGGPEQGYKHLVDSSLGWGMNLPALKAWLDEHNPDGRERVYLSYFGNDNPDYYGIRATRLPGYFEHRKFQPYTLTSGYFVISASIFQGVHTAAFGPWSKEYEKLYRETSQHCRDFAQSATNPAWRARLLRQASMAVWLNEFDLFESLWFARLCAWLRHQGEPPEHIGHSMFIWKLDEAAIRAALDGPPVELVDRPAKLRRFREFAVTGQ